MTPSIQHAIALMIAGLLISGCAQTNGNWRTVDTDNFRGKRTVTDCSPFTEVTTTPRDVIRDHLKPAVRARFELHYDALNKDIIRSTAVKVLLHSDRNFGDEGSDADGIVTKFTQSAIPVYINTVDAEDISMAMTAIRGMNIALEKRTTVRLIPKMMGKDRATGNLSGIHVYFGSAKCMWKVFKEQSGIEKSVITQSAKFKLDRLNGITLREGLTNNGHPTGRIHRSLVVILNVEDPAYKQHVIEHELLHALGLKGHPGPFLWSRLSSVAGSIAPELHPTYFDDHLLQFLYSEAGAGETQFGTTQKLKRWWIDKTPRRRQGSDKCALEIATRQNTGETLLGVELAKALFCKPSPAS